MYSKVVMLPVTGGGSAAAAASVPMGSPLFWVFLSIAAFTIIGTFGAMVRTLPPMTYLQRAPKQLEPKVRLRR